MGARITRLASLLAGLTLTAPAGCTGNLLVGDDDTGAPQDDDDTAGPPLGEDIFDQTADPVDILFVVDNSASMQEEQTALMSNFWTFIQHLVSSGIDYHIGVTVLDDWEGQPAIGELYGTTPFIDADVEDPVGAFTGNMTMGDDGVGQCELGLEASYRALSEPLLSGTNAGFYRDEARLTLVIISDEADGSATGQCPDGLAWTDFVPWLTSLKGAGSLDRIHFAAIAGEVPDGCWSEWGTADPGHGYWDVYQALGEDHATFFSICEHDWSPVMSELGQMASSMQTEFPLGQLPVPDTLEVYLDPDGPDGPDEEIRIYEDPSYTQQWAFTWYEGTNSLVFVTETRPAAGSRLRAIYEIE
jgi:hypothetical protein